MMVSIEHLRWILRCEQEAIVRQPPRTRTGRRRVRAMHHVSISTDCANEGQSSLK